MIECPICMSVNKLYIDNELAWECYNCQERFWLDDGLNTYCQNGKTLEQAYDDLRDFFSPVPILQGYYNG